MTGELPSTSRTFHVADYDLGSTLGCGQAFRWRQSGNDWIGVVGGRWVRLREGRGGIRAETAGPVDDWRWLADYLQADVSLDRVLSTFPDDEPMRVAVKACRGLRLLRQEPWECLASFILSSTKQIVQIQQVISLLCERFGDPVAVPPGHPPAWSFPGPARLAGAREAQLRACKMGFRAPYLLEAARRVQSGELNLDGLHDLGEAELRARLMTLHGVGRKIADCVLLFAYGHPAAFPVDVWVLRALKELYFAGRRVTPATLQAFAAGHFGSHAGYAQQYLFHYMRSRDRMSP